MCVCVCVFICIKLKLLKQLTKTIHFWYGGAFSHVVSMSLGQTQGHIVEMLILLH